MNFQTLTGNFYLIVAIAVVIILLFLYFYKPRETKTKEPKVTEDEYNDLINSIHEKQNKI